MSLVLAVELDGDGAHPSAWRRSRRSPGAVLGGAALRASVHDAERAGFDLATFADTPSPPGGGPDAAGRVEAGTRAAFVATSTSRIGLAPTLHVTTTEPFHLATQLASLDHATRGRAGWVLGAANDVASAATVGGVPLDPAGLHREITDVLDTARALWDSWQDDAVIRDVAAGRYLDPDRVHHVDVTAARFTVKGPLITPRPPQGQLVVLAPEELDVAGRADVVLVGGADPADVADRAERARGAGAARVLAEVQVVLDTDRPGVERLAELDGHTPWPDDGRLRHVGPAAGLVALLRRLAPVVDGVRLHPAVLADDLAVLTGRVLPELADLRAAAGDTLRGTFGLTRPENRFAVRGGQS